MGTTAEKLTYLNETKTQLKDMLNLGGASLTTEPFRQYVDTLKNRYLYFMNNGTQQVWNNWDKTTGTGTILTLNNTEEAPMSLVYKGNTKQNGTPTPDNPVPIQVVSGDNTIDIVGKNLWSKEKATLFVSACNTPSIVYITTKDNRNCLRYNPSAGYGSYDTKNFSLGVKFKENTQYTISYDIFKEDSDNKTVAIYYTDGTYTTNASVSLINTWEHQTITSTAGKTIKYIAPFYTSGVSYLDIDTFQIEEGTTATTYEAYKGASYPITLPEGMFLGWIGTYQDGFIRNSGKNFYDSTKLNHLAFASRSNNIEILISSNTYIGYAIPCNEGEVYSISRLATTNSRFRVMFSSEEPAQDVAIFGGTGNINTYDSALKIENIVVPSGAKYMNIYLSNANETIPPIMINKGTTALPYEPYGNGDLYVKKELKKHIISNTDIASISSYWYSTYGQYGATIDKTKLGISGVSDRASLCNIAIKINALRNIAEHTYIFNANAGALYFFSSTYDTVEHANEELVGAEIIYNLDIPEYTKITGELESQLNALIGAKSYNSQTNISQENNDMPFELNVEALKEM